MTTATGTGRTAVCDDRSDETQLIDAVRRGDNDAFGELYALHSTDVCQLARRLCRDRYEADDVVSEVFVNTLRALRRGSGPSDALRPYLLRSVRNTVIKVRTRTDSGRATPCSPDTLDRPHDHDPFRAPGAASTAFGAVSERHRRVLWSVEVEGMSTSRIAESEDIAAPAAASLAYRARCALRRAYIDASIAGPAAEACKPIRGLMPSFVEGGLGAAKSATVLGHCERCAECAEALAAARTLKAGLSDKAPFAMLLIGVRALISLVGRSAAGIAIGAPVAAVAGSAALFFGLGVVVDAESTSQDVVAVAAASPADARSTDAAPLEIDRTYVVPVQLDQLAPDDVTNPSVGRAGGGDVVATDAPPLDRTDGPNGVSGHGIPDPVTDPVVDLVEVVDLVDGVDGVDGDDLVEGGDVVTDVVDTTLGLVDTTLGVVDSTTDVVDTVVVVVDRTTRTVTDSAVVDTVVDRVRDVEQPVTAIVDDSVADVTATAGTVIDTVVETSVGGLLDELGLGG